MIKLPPHKQITLLIYVFFVFLETNQMLKYTFISNKHNPLDKGKIFEMIKL